jgi:hypothetical protein
MPRNKTIPHTAISRPDTKSVRFGHYHQGGKPVWRFSTVDQNGPFRWPKGSREELSIVEKLHDFDSMNWADIQGRSHHILCPTSLSREALKRLKEIELDDIVENLFSFRLAGVPRFIAFKIGDTANLLWYDPNHKVAPSTLRNT